LEKHPELEPEKRQKYESQIDVLKRICAEYERDDQGTTENAATELTKDRFETISTLMVELQSYGYPPEELVGITPPGWSVDPTSGLPAIDDVHKASESCNVM
uniref:Peroxin-19 n=1 Tax=Anisakis simplex TaxID=6269 RepID=A0A0M3J7B4_ANISI